MEARPLEERLVASADRPDTAAALMEQAMPGMTARMEAGESPLLLRVAVAQAGPVRVADVRLRGTARLAGSGPAGVVATGVLLAGRLDAEYARHRIDAGRPFLRPSGPANLVLRDVHLRLVDLDADRVRTAAERAADRDGARLRLLRTRPVSDEAADAWRWAAACLNDGLLAAPSDNPMVREELFTLGVRVLLSSFGEPVASASAPDVRAAPTAVRRAVAYLEEHAGGAVSVPEVAAAARVSPRSLQALFRRHLGVTPLAHLHAIRLDAARRDLQGAHGGGETVHDVAVRWGFGNSGRFARLYSERFGERPSETLRLG